MATVTIQKDLFEIKDSKKHIEKIQILSGQLSPPPASSGEPFTKNGRKRRVWVLLELAT